ASSGNGRAGGAAAPFGRGIPSNYFAMLHKPENRDPRGYIIPSDQPDFLSATKFVNTLIRNGVTVDKATAPFTVNGKHYPAGSYVVKTDQAFRPHILDMFEPQDYPNDFRYPGGPPIPPYDMTGWTLAYQMGVHFDRVLDGFDGPFQPFDTLFAPPPGRVAGSGSGYLLSHETNDAFIAVNKLLQAKHDVYWLEAPVTVKGQHFGQGTFYIPASSSVTSMLRTMAQQLGVDFVAAPSRPVVQSFKMHPVRIGLWDEYGGSIPSGWTRWLLEQYDFPYQLVFPQELDAGNLKQKFDVLIFVEGAIPSNDRGGRRGFGRQPSANEIPAEYRNRLGSVTVEKTVPQLKQFLEAGGTILTVGSSANLAYDLGLPVSNALVERKPDGTVKPLTQEQFYVPGSVLQVAVDTTQPLAAGIGTAGKVDVMFDNDPVLRLAPDANAEGLHAVAWFDSPTPLRSGWAWGQGYLDNGVAVTEAQVGKGRLVMFGPRITFRAQPHGTFKFLFNGIYYRSGEAGK
ncbi:MAG TPA: peptidase, partial [Gemmatimonadaceae bacterium]|nr:peptidase [Gemmatimonadaceae bacterium]